MPPIVASRAQFLQYIGDAWDRLLDSLAAALLRPDQGELAQGLNRLLLVAGLVERRSFYGRPLHRQQMVQLLAHRSVLLPDPPFPAVLPARQVALVRQTATSDLFVVRKEWRGYLTDEIAEIRNVMAGETSDMRFVRLDETQVVETTASSVDTSSEQSTESASESTFSETAQRELDLALKANAQVNVSADYGTVKLDASAGFSADFSLKDSTQRATEVAKKAVAKAASKVASQTREERVTRTLTRTEQRQRHTLANASTAHTRGVLRWVSRIDRFQLWRYPDRLQLEFEIPEPGRFLREQLGAAQPRAGSVGQPPVFQLPEGGITPENYLQLAATYGASGMPEPPQARTGVSAAVALQSEVAIPAGQLEWNAPVLTKNVEVAITPGYAATSVKVNIRATPLHAAWRREMTDHQGYDQQEGFATITATVAAADQMVFDLKGGSGAGNTNSIMHSASGDRVVTQYLDGHLNYQGSAAALAHPITVKLPIAVTLVGAWAGTVGIEVACELTEQARDRWIQDVYDTLWAAHSAWAREWRAEQAMAGYPPALAERSPTRNAQMVRDEVRRHVVAWLLGESPFGGRNAVPPDRPGVDTTPDINLPAALASAPTIQFLEQCMEWSNLAWVAYPYYWAERARWSDLMDLETVDPDLGAFLRAGSIRVVVPARPGFADAVIHWLTYRQPWRGGGRAPVPGDQLYVSVAREIRDQLQPPVDGEPGESWEVSLPTTLQWLDDEAAGLPLNANARLGRHPNEPAEPLLEDPTQA